MLLVRKPNNVIITYFRRSFESVKLYYYVVQIIGRLVLENSNTFFPPFFTEQYLNGLLLFYLFFFPLFRGNATLELARLKKKTLN